VLPLALLELVEVFETLGHLAGDGAEDLIGEGELCVSGLELLREGCSGPGAGRGQIGQERPPLGELGDQGLAGDGRATVVGVGVLAGDGVYGLSGGRDLLEEHTGIGRLAMGVPRVSDLVSER